MIKTKKDMDNEEKVKTPRGRKKIEATEKVEVKEEEQLSNKIWIMYHPEFINDYDGRTYIIDGEEVIINQGTIEVDNEKKRDILFESGFMLLLEKEKEV